MGLLRRFLSGAKRPGSAPRTAFVYTDRYAGFSYGANHPMRPKRLEETFELIKDKGLLDLPGVQLVEARRALDEEILLFHTPGYLKALKEADSGKTSEELSAYRIGAGDNPVFEGVFEFSTYSTGASLQAAELAASGKVDTAFNIAGGLHHARAGSASGFCYLNDAAVAIKYLVGLGKRVAYVDIDAHHGDGVEEAFYDTNRVLTVSLHESGRWLFPGTGFPRDMGEGEGTGYSVNLPFPPPTGDDLFIRGFNAVVGPFIEAFRPDILVTQLGVDTFGADPITHMNLTCRGFLEALKAFRAFGVPWVALGGGGYDMETVKTAWTLAWAVMNGVEESEWATALTAGGGLSITMEEHEKFVEEGVDFLTKEVLPKVKGR
jgi:acetoin utilization protein AcuC